MNKVPPAYQPNSSMAIWLEARRRCRNHLREGLILSGMKPHEVANMKLEDKVDELLCADSGEYVRVAFVKLKVEATDDND